MFSELIEQLKDEAARCGKAVGKVGQLRLIGIVSRVLGLFLLILNVSLCVLALFAFGAVAAIDAMSAYLPVWAAALIVGSFYLLLIIVAICARKPLFIHPFIALLSKQLIHTQEELEFETLKAEKDVEVEVIRIETNVNNAVNEFHFFTNLISGFWKMLFKRKVKKQ